MDKKNRQRLLVTILGFMAPVAFAQEDVNQSLEMYCNASDAEYKQSVTLGVPKTLVLKAGSFNQLETDSSYRATIDYITNGLTRVGLTSECAEYLLSKSSLRVENDGEVFARVYFDFNKYQLTKSSQYVLDNVAKQLQETPTDLIVEGHADAIGSHSYNFSLGLKRSNEVIDYLEENGVDKKNLVAISKGEKMPIATNLTETGRAKNRRVDLIEVAQ
ncbi:OmpA family protein [Vibrio sp. SCSIO 43136]|uniref:OmpA family protein n=1 Tax=Vibrio sp. SCSIO 43136 TaxID=2819101 RepID=UPI002075559F|nr:OmpA family protein [Vibrio sp. SCSIO 43136]USD64731.1 OmpA family protein [Vibrio sp. SCSIO 43136]